MSDPPCLVFVLSMSWLRHVYILSIGLVHALSMSCLYLFVSCFGCVLFYFFFIMGPLFFSCSSNQSLSYLQRTGLPRAGHIQLTKSRLVMKGVLCRCLRRCSCPAFVLSLSFVLLFILSTLDAQAVSILWALNIRVIGISPW